MKSIKNLKEKSVLQQHHVNQILAFSKVRITKKFITLLLGAKTTLCNEIKRYGNFVYYKRFDFIFECEIIGARLIRAAFLVVSNWLCCSKNVPLPANGFLQRAFDHLMVLRDIFCQDFLLRRLTPEVIRDRQLSFYSNRLDGMRAYCAQLIDPDLVVNSRLLIGRIGRCARLFSVASIERNVNRADRAL